VKPFTFLKDNEALILTASRPFIDDREGKSERFVGDEYLFKGPGTYIPRIEESIKSRIEAILVLPNHGLLLKAKRDTVDSLGQKKRAGERVRFLILMTVEVVTPQEWILPSNS